MIEEVNGESMFHFCFFVAEMFVEVQVFFNRLTNEESRKNWEEHGNPDGPGGI